MEKALAVGGVRLGGAVLLALPENSQEAPAFRHGEEPRPVTAGIPRLQPWGG
jgi:hypothetical protein